MTNDYHTRQDYKDRYLKLLSRYRFIKWFSIISTLLMTISLLSYCTNHFPYKVKLHNNKPEIIHESFHNQSPKISAYKINIPSEYYEVTTPVTLKQLSRRWHVSVEEIRDYNDWLSNIPNNQPIHPSYGKPSIDVPPTKPVTPPPNTSSNMDQWENEVLQLTNKERANVGLKPLQPDSKLQQSAKAKSKDMNDKNYFSHQSPTYGSPFDMMKAFGITYNAAAENIAQGQQSPQEVVTAWMNSSGHRANILNGQLTHLGVGFVKGNNKYYWTQQFISK